MKQLNRLWILLAVLAVAVLMPAAFAGTSAVLAAAPTGAGPLDPLMVTGAPQTLAPNASVWYYFDYGASRDRYKAEVDVDANGAGNLGLAIFTPEQANAWMQDPTTKPVGIGTKPGAATSAAIHDLVWQGAFNTSGRYFAVVTNNNASPVSFRLLVSGGSVTLAPTVTPSPYPTPLFATPVPTTTIQGKLLFQDASGGNIYTVNGDGSNLKRITTGIDPAYSPDASKIAFSRWTYPAGVFVANADGTNEQALYAGNQTLSPQWSPDQTRLVFTRQSGGTPGSSICFGPFGCFDFPDDPHWKLTIVNVNDKSVFDPSSTAHSLAPTWRSDGKTIAYADGTFGVMGTIPTGGAPFNIFTQNPDVQAPMYSADGSKIAFMVRQHDHFEINTMNADGSNVVALTKANPLAFTVTNNVAPTWSPDGSQILFLSDRGGKWEFYVVNPDGTGLKQVLKNVSDSLPIRYNFSSERVIDWIK